MSFKSPIPIAIMMIGIPGSGKSTYANKLANILDIEIISSDSIREELTGDAENQNVNSKVFDLVYQRMRKNLIDGNSVIIDSTAIKKWHRTKFFETLEGLNAIPIAWFIDTDLQVCLERNSNRSRHVPENVIFNMYKSFEHPELDEGFDWILTNDSGIKLFETLLKTESKDES